MSTKGMLLGFALGLSVGAVVGLLYAPKSGEETRQTICDKTTVACSKLKFNLYWLLMSPRERYRYLWNHGGSLRRWCRENATASSG